MSQSQSQSQTVTPDKTILAMSQTQTASSETAMQKPKASFKPKPKGNIPSEPAESSAPVPHDYLIPMFRNYEYARVVMRAPTPYEAKAYAENLFANDGWEVYEDWTNYKVIDIPSGGYE